VKLFELIGITGLGIALLYDEFFRFVIEVAISNPLGSCGQLCILILLRYAYNTYKSEHRLRLLPLLKELYKETRRKA
jgi:hypothetical protein